MKLPRQDELIPRLGLLYTAIAQTTSDEAKRREIMRELEQLPYYLRGACAAIYQLESARCNSAQAFAEVRKLIPESELYWVTGEQCHELSFAVDFCLTCLRRVPDSLICYLNRFPVRLGLPNSFHKLIIGLGTKYNLDDKLKDLVSAYWQSIGSGVKDYRDRAHHTAIVSSECLLFLAADGRIGLRMLLPNNPSETSPCQLNYDPGVPAMNYLLSALSGTLKFANEIVNRLLEIIPNNGAGCQNATLPIFFGRGGPIALGGGISWVGEPVPYPGDISAILAQAVK